MKAALYARVSTAGHGQAELIGQEGREPTPDERLRIGGENNG